MLGNRSRPRIALPKHRPSREIGRTAHGWEARSWLGQNRSLPPTESQRAAQDLCLAGRSTESASPWSGELLGPGNSPGPGTNVARPTCLPPK